jgi:hypothetical protein
MVAPSIERNENSTAWGTDTFLRGTKATDDIGKTTDNVATAMALRLLKNISFSFAPPPMRLCPPALPPKTVRLSCLERRLIERLDEENHFAVGSQPFKVPSFKFKVEG